MILNHNLINLSSRKSISLPASKSVANRALIICKAAGLPFDKIENLPAATDTQNLKNALLNAELSSYSLADGAAPFRFFTAYKAALNQPCFITGTDVLLQRPILPLIDALQNCGADITLEPKGIRIISGMKTFSSLEMDAAQSSQFASALMMIAPLFPGEKQILFKSPPSSLPYLQLTAGIMKDFGVNADVTQQKVVIPEGSYQAPPIFHVEADWSAAAFFFSRAAVSPNETFILKNLNEKSAQGDKAAIQAFARLGVEATFIGEDCHIQKKHEAETEPVFDVRDTPDMAPAIIAACAFLRISAKFYGLENLRFKESDRILAMNQNLKQVGAELIGHSDVYGLCYPASPPAIGSKLFIHTFSDHRIAMAMSLFMLQFQLEINNQACVAKSFPDFWEVWVG